MNDAIPQYPVAIIGAGPIGLGAVYWARELGAGPIAVTAASRQRESIAMQMGANSFVLPENKVEGEKIAAKYTDGILYITIPKKEEAKVKPVKQIAIS